MVKKYREAVENSLARMKKGSNRVAGGDSESCTINIQGDCCLINFL